APEGDQRSPVEVRITNLKKRIDEQDAQQKAAEVNKAGNGEKESSPGTASTAGTATPPQADQSSRSNVPAFVLLGVGALAAGGAVLTGVLAKGEYDDAKDKCSPHCSDSDVKSGKSLALISTVLTGAAVVSASVGAVLYFTNQPSHEKTAKKKHTPQWAVAV